MLKIKNSNLKRKIIKIVLAFFVLILILSIPIALSVRNAIVNSKKAAAAIQNQDLEGAKTYLKKAQGNFKTAKGAMIVFTPIRPIPLIGWYVADANRVFDGAIDGLQAGLTFADAVTPYADVLGLKGQGNFLGGTAQERLSKAVETLAVVTPKIDSVGQDLQRARTNIDKIQSWRYPNFLPGKPGQKVELAKTTVDELESLIVDTKPFLEVLPDIMGQKGEKKYLIIFQNDKELRPTGGFITAYAIFDVNKGAIKAETSSDIYKLDSTLTKKVPAPGPIIKYLPNVPTLNLRDSNLSPDFKLSMDTFAFLYQYTQNTQKVDGIIALDTQFVVNMMNVLGTLEVGGTKYTTDKVDECNCPQIIHELEKSADVPVAEQKSERKGLVGVLMSAMMDKSFNSSKTSWPALLGAVTGSLRQKDLLLYFYDDKVQTAVEKVNFAGRLFQYDGDYLHINETNFAGAKSNLFIQQKVKLESKKNKEGTIDAKLTIDYKYPRKMDNCSLERKGGLCLAGIYRDWIRIYVPKGAKLVKSSGIDLTQTEDLGKTVFEGFFELRPEGALKFEIDYTSPIKVQDTYNLLLQKQPGTPNISYEINALGHKEKPFPLDTDKEIIFKP